MHSIHCDRVKTCEVSEKEKRKWCELSSISLFLLGSFHTFCTYKQHAVFQDIVGIAGLYLFFVCVFSLACCVGRVSTLANMAVLLYELSFYSFLSFLILFFSHDFISEHPCIAEKSVPKFESTLSCGKSQSLTFRHLADNRRLQQRFFMYLYKTVIVSRRTGLLFISRKMIRSDQRVLERLVDVLRRASVPQIWAD